MNLERCGVIRPTVCYLQGVQMPCCPIPTLTLGEPGHGKKGMDALASALDRLKSSWQNARVSCWHRNVINPSTSVGLPATVPGDGDGDDERVGVWSKEEEAT